MPDESNKLQFGPVQHHLDDYRIFKGHPDEFFAGAARAIHATINEQCSERFCLSSAAALAEAEDIEESILILDADGQAALDRATDLRYAGTRDAIVAYALVGKEAPAEIVGPLLQRTFDCLCRIVRAQSCSVGGFGSGVVVSVLTGEVAEIVDHRTDATYTTNPGRLLEELRRESPGAGPDGVIRAVKRAILPYEPPTIITQE